MNRLNHSMHKLNYLTHPPPLERDFYYKQLNKVFMLHYKFCMLLIKQGFFHLVSKIKIFIVTHMFCIFFKQHKNSYFRIDIRILEYI